MNTAFAGWKTALIQTNTGSYDFQHSKKMNLFRPLLLAISLSVN
jgi:hypothetical protein